MDYLSMKPLAADIKATFSKTITERRDVLLFLATLDAQGKAYHFDDSIDDCLSHIGAQERSIIEARVADCFATDVCPFSVVCALSNSEHEEDNDDNRTNYVQYMAELIAPVFCDIVKSELADDLEEIIERNKSYDEGICATHDFCDANELMHDAATMFNVNVGGSLDGVENTMMELNHRAWGKAWGMAKAAEFNSAKVGA